VTAALAVFCFAAVPRLAYLVWARPVFEERYWLLATGLLERGVFGFNGQADTGYPPLYPLFLAGTRWVIGDRPLGVQIVQVLVVSAGAPLLFFLTLRLTGLRRAAWIAAGLFAIYPLLVRHAAESDPYSLVGTLLLAFAVVFASARTSARMAAAGAWLGLAVLARTAVLPVLPLAAAALAFDRRAKAAAALTAATLLVFAPLVLRTHAVSGAWLPTRDGMNLYIANSEYTDALLPAEHPDLLQDHAMAVVTAEHPELAERPVFDAELNDRLADAALASMSAHPLRTIVLKMKSVVYYFWPRLVPTRVADDATTIELGPGGRAVVHDSVARPIADELAYSLTYFPVLLLALAGAYLRRRDVGRDAVLWAILATFTAVHAVFVPATRYRVATEFVLLYFAAVAADRWLGDRLRASVPA
jgi:4-amino-4-deoxy-L-arabinose transferase-like glycosyltransferase